MPNSPCLLPYCGGRRREDALRRALDSLAIGQFQGERQLSNAGSHRFRLDWSPIRSPLETSRCQLALSDVQQEPYRFACPAHRLVQWLMDVEAGSPAIFRMRSGDGCCWSGILTRVPLKL